MIWFLSMLLLISPAFAKNAVDVSNINEEKIKVINIINKLCDKHKPPNSRDKCHITKLNEMTDAGKWPGSNEYCEKYYLSMSSPELLAKYHQLSVLQSTARPYAARLLDYHIGEMTYDDYQIEIRCIQKELVKRKLTIKAGKHKSELID